MAEELYVDVLDMISRSGDPDPVKFARSRLETLGSLSAWERDLAWSIPLYRAYERGIEIWDFVSQARAGADLRESVRRDTAYVLAWSLTTSHRELRDQSTKALVQLVHRDVDLGAELIRDFGRLDDDYVVERVCAACYGATMRSQARRDTALRLADPLETNRLAVHPHLGVRFYARALLEQADRSSFPTGSSAGRWPEQLDLPALGHRFLQDDGRHDPIWSSIQGFGGDFGIYVTHHFPFGHHADGRLSRAEVRAAVAWQILQLGWRPDPDVYAFDRSCPRAPRIGVKPERLGKKYQWMAWRRVQALAMDRLVPVSGTDSDWLRTAVDIDPTLLLQRQEATEAPVWWNPATPELVGDEAAAQQWLGGPRHVRETVEVTDPEGHQWLALQFSRRWGRYEGSGERATRRYWLAGRAYLVRSEDAEAAEAWANGRPTWGWDSWSDSLEPSDLVASRVMFREYWDSPAFFESVERPDFGHGPPVPFVPTGRSYLCEQGNLDMSIETPISLWLPHERLVDLLGLQHGESDGDYVDDNGRVLLRDPSASGEGPGTLLLRADAAAELHRVGYDVVWLILGEKTIPEGEADGGPSFAMFSGTLRATGSSDEQARWIDHVSVPPTEAGVVRAAAAPSPGNLPEGERGPLLTAKRLGVRASAMAEAETRGDLERVVPGVYVGSDVPVTDLTAAAGWSLRHPAVVIGLLTAAAHYDLVDAHPRGTWMFVPKGQSPPRSETVPVHVIRTTRFVDPEDDELNGIRILRLHGVDVRITDPDRTVLDLWRYPKRVSREHATIALSRHLRAESFDPGRFRRLAERLGVWDQLEVAVAAMGAQ